MNTTLHAFVIEDDAHSLVAIGSLLDELGIAYKRNTTGANVARQLQEMRPWPDFILLNIDLPDGDAFAICRELRAFPCTQTIPIIAVADDFSPEMLKAVRAGGFDAYVLKPLPRRCFSQCLQRVIAGEQMLDSGMICPADAPVVIPPARSDRSLSLPHGS